MNQETSTPARLPFSAFPAEARYAGIFLAAMAAFVAYDQSHWWSSREDYSFGYLVPFFAAFVVYDRLPKIAAFFQTGSIQGGAVAAPGSRGPLGVVLGALALCGFVGGLLSFGLGAFLFGASGSNLLPGTQAMSAGLAACILSGAFLFGDRTADGRPTATGERLRFAFLFLFPALIWMLSAPMLDFLETAISLFLLDKVTFVVFNVFDILAVPLTREGNTLILEKGRVGVEDACSGIRSLMACLFAGSFLSAVFLDKFWKKVLLVAMAMLFAFLMNLVRSLFLTFWAHLHGSDAISDPVVLPLLGDIGNVHDVTGYSVLGFTCLGLILLLPLFSLGERIAGRHREASA